MRKQKKEMIAMILAGGQGTRLKSLTKKIAKPAVHFGGKYRIIDFALSNCSNSNIDTVGVLTQYQPMVLNAHIGIGIPWDLDRMDGGVSVLPPHVGPEGGRWFKGTANAIYENLDFIDSHNPEYVLILSGDHIYKMDYSKMLESHKINDSDATIAVLEVPWDEASRFGIMNVEKDGSIYEFDEKPENPKSNLASMGIYIFTWKVLKEYLIKDEKDENSSNDFGKNIIPTMLEDGKRMYSYKFNGYWKDVGTIKSLWEANMDLLRENNDLNLYDSSWKIYSVNPMNPPHYVSESGKVNNSLLSEGCVIDGEVENSVLFPGVHVKKGAKIVDSVVMPDAKILENAIVERAIVEENYVVKEDEHIGNKEAEEIVVIG